MGKSWHQEYKDSAWVFLGGLPYEMTEGDIICMFSQYGEPVHINLIRDHNTGKSKGFGFLCYMDQRSTILAVDNLNATKVLGRTIRVDHVHQYKLPKDLEKLDQDKRKLFEEGCAPKPIDPSESEEDDEDEVLPMKVKKEKKEKKKKKDKKHKKKKKRKYSTDSQTDSEENIRDRHKIVDGRHDDRTHDRPNRMSARDMFEKENQRNGDIRNSNNSGNSFSRDDRRSRSRERKHRSRSRERRDRSRSRERRYNRSRSNDRSRRDRR